jgi:hypothetical protein
MTAALVDEVRPAANTLSFCSRARRDAIGAVPSKAVTKVAVTAAVVAASAGDPLKLGPVAEVAADGLTAELDVELVGECFELLHATRKTALREQTPKATANCAWSRGIV